jgi:hypothetical protein
MLKKVFASFALVSLLVVAFGTNAEANPPSPEPKTLACYTTTTPCDHNRECCSGLCAHHKCVKN